MYVFACCFELISVIYLFLFLRQKEEQKFEKKDLLILDI